MTHLYLGRKFNIVNVLPVVVIVCIQRCFCLHVDLVNDGPVVIDTPITFTANLAGSYVQEDYIYVFEDKTNLRKRQEVRGRDTAQATYLYTDDELTPRVYIMTLQVYNTIFGYKAWVVATAEASFTLTSGLVGDIRLEQDGHITKSTKVKTNSTVNATVALHDPSDFFRNANITYMWTLDKKHIGTNGTSTILQNFTVPRRYNISVLVIAEINTTSSKKGPIKKFGSFESRITAMDVINRVNFTGNTWLARDKDLSIQISCSGSSPYSYCIAIDVDNATNSRNISCQSPVVTNICNFRVGRYFPAPGQYFLALNMSNEVSFLNRAIEIHVYEIPHRPQLSFVIIPVVCSILAIVIVVFGIAYHLSHRPRDIIEVADFDFQNTGDMTERTFLERVKDTVAKSWRGSLFHTLKKSRESDNYEEMLDEDDESIASSRIPGTPSTSGKSSVESKVTPSQSA